MEFCSTLDMIGGYFAKALKESQVLRFCNIIIGIREDNISSYNASVRSFLEELKIKPEKDK